MIQLEFPKTLHKNSQKRSAKISQNIRYQSNGKNTY